MLSRAWEWILACTAVLALAVLGTSATAQSGGYVIKPGDTLRIEVFEDASLNRDVLILPDGSFSFPLVGSLSAKGRTVNQVRSDVRNGLAPNFATPPSVHVAIAALAPETTSTGTSLVDLFAIGEVANPGLLQVEPGITLLQFLAAAGGLDRFAADKRIELIRTDSKTGAVSTYLFNYRLPQGSATTIAGNTELYDGDVVKVPQKRLFE